MESIVCRLHLSKSSELLIVANDSLTNVCWDRKISAKPVGLWREISHGKRVHLTTIILEPRLGLGDELFKIKSTSLVLLLLLWLFMDSASFPIYESWHLPEE